jgi:hypothetical protein
LATALAFSQLLTEPERLQTRFDHATDQSVVVELLRAGCMHMHKGFDVEDINLDELIATAMDDPQAIADESRSFVASISPICRSPTANSARARRWLRPGLISAR